MNAGRQMKALMTIEEVATYFNISKYTLYRMIQKKEIPALKIGNQWRFKKEDLDDWLETHSIPANCDGNAESAKLEG